MWGNKFGRTKLTLIFLAIVLLLLGCVVVWYTWHKSQESFSEQVLKTAQMVGAVFPIDMVGGLEAGPADLEKKNYQDVKTSLLGIANVNKDIRFAYIYTQKDGQLVFLADSEPTDSENYSPPGQVYTEADVEYQKPFADGKALVTKQVVDRWGRWVSALVPIKDMNTGEVVAVFALDYPASQWNMRALTQTAQVALIVLVLLVLLFSIFSIINSNAEIRESEKNFRSFFESTDDVIVAVNKQRRIVYANRATVQKLGYSLKELLRMHVVDINQKSKKEEAEKIFADMLLGKTDICQLPLERKNGTLIPSETRVWFGKWGGEDCVFGITKDLSLEQESLQKFNKIFDKNPVIMAISSAVTRKLIDVNQEFLNKVGYTKEEVLGKTAPELELFADPAVNQFVYESLKKDGFVHNLDVKVKTKSGGLLEGIYFGDVIESQGEKYFLSALVDQTERKKIEADIKKKNTELEKLNNFMVNRELKMTELKKELERLKKK